MHIKSWQTILSLTVVSFVLVLAEIPRQDWFTTAAMSLAAGATAFSLMGAAALLGGRWRSIEGLFGGLDRMYLTHKWLGVWALGFASFHLVFKAGMQGWETASIVTLSPFYTRLVRQLSFVALMLIVMLALNRKIPYSTWRWWHKLSGPLFLVVVAHWLSIKSPVALASPAGGWLAGLSGLAVVAAAWKLLLYPALSRHATYRLLAVASSGTAVYLRLAPERRPLPFRPGQFAFLSFEHEGLREPHPFTIASAQQSDGSIAFMVRASGDYTARLVAEARPGLVARVYAPFGRFTRAPEDGTDIWIAGGVGVTPFLAWLQDPDARGLERVTFFHFFTPGRELPAGVDLPGLARSRGVELVEVAGGPGDTRFRHRFAQLVANAGPAGVRVRFCGPRGLLGAVRAVMRESGVPENRLQHELFEFR